MSYFTNRGIVALPSSWTPATALTGGGTALAWWDADLGVTKTGADVTVWTDQAHAYTMGLNTVPGGEVAPSSPQFSSSSFGGKAGISFSGLSGGTPRYLCSGVAAVGMGSTTKPAHWMAATISNAGDPFGRITSMCDGTGTDAVAANGLCTLRDAQRVQAVPPAGGLGPTAITYDVPFRAGAKYDGTNGTLNVNAVAGTPFAATYSALPSLQFCFGNGEGALNNLTGIIRRVLITGGDLSAGDLTNIDTWLQG